MLNKIIILAALLLPACFANAHEYKAGELEVTKRTLEITADSDSKIYDGTALNNSGSSITAGKIGRASCREIEWRG